MNWYKGKQIAQGQYSILEMLKEGGFGITYLAIRKKDSQQVVIKTLNDKVQAYPNFRKFKDRFIKEANRLQKLDNPNIVKFHELIYDGELPCIVMDYIEGLNLEDLVKDQGVLVEKEAIEYTKQIGSALIYIHNNHGTLHRDIKPRNIMICKNTNNAVLIDFGIAREFEDNNAVSTVFVSYGFAAPEQYSRNVCETPSPDVHGLAATLYVMLTGYDKNGDHYLPSVQERVNSFVNTNVDVIRPPKSINYRISKNVNEAIIKGLKFDPKDRPETVHKFLDMLNLDDQDTQRVDNMNLISDNSLLILFNDLVSVFWKVIHKFVSKLYQYLFSKLNVRNRNNTRNYITQEDLRQRDNLQNLLNEIAQNNKNISGIAIVDNYTVLLKSQDYTATQFNSIDNNNILELSYSIKTVVSSSNPEEGQIKFLTLLLEKAVCTSFILNRDQNFSREFVVIFFLFSENPLKFMGLHHNVCREKILEIKELLSQWDR